MMSNEKPLMAMNSNGDNLTDHPATLEEWKAKAEALWCLLDDIDTASDMFKPEQTNFYKYVMKRAKLRFDHLKSDGYELFNTGNKRDDE